jgi:hypothetical protein
LEIYGFSPHETALAAADPDNQASTSQADAAANLGAAPVPQTAAGDRVELVRTQNLASPVPVDLDAHKAALLLRQVAQELKLMERQDMRQLYQFERLRDLCCRLHGATEA